MSQRAAWQLERLGFGEVYDFVAGKSYWIASARPTIRTTDEARVSDQMRTDPVTARPDETVGAAQTRGDDGGDVVVVNEHDIVVGIVGAASLTAADPDEALGTIMSVGPTTVRPDEPLENLQARMGAKSVRSIIVTKPTGELVGVYHSTTSPKP